MNLPSDPAHPLWASVRFVAIVAGITVVMYSSSHVFDADDIVRIIGAAAAVLGVNGASALISRGAKR